MSAKKTSPHDPLKTHALKGDLKALKAKLDAEEAARKAEAEARKKPGDAPAKPSPAKAPTPKRSSGVEVWRPENFDQRLFEVAMAGVAPLAPKKPARVAAPKGQQPAPGTPEAKARQRLAEGGATLTPRWADDNTVSAAWPGQDFALTALGRFVTPEETLDLHGVEPGAVALRVESFLQTRRAKGLRCVSVVTGHGKRSPDGASVLFDETVKALTAPVAAKELVAFASAPAELGGRGAILVALRT